MKAYGVFSHDVTAAMLVSQNEEMAAMLVSQTKPLGIELYFYVNYFFCFSKPIWPVVTWMKTLYIKILQSIKRDWKIHPLDTSYKPATLTNLKVTGQLNSHFDTRRIGLQKLTLTNIWNLLFCFICCRCCCCRVYVSSGLTTTKIGGCIAGLSNHFL